jgi:hypothetical protein
VLVKLLVVAVLVLALFVAFATRYRLGTRRYWTLRGLIAHVCATLRFPIPTESFAALDAVTLPGALPGGRGARVSFHERHVIIAVRADEHASVALSVSEARLLDRLKRFVRASSSVSVGHRAFDERFQVEAADPATTRKRIGTDERRAIESLFDRAHVRRLSLGEGRLVAEADARALEVADYPFVCDRLDAIARAFDRGALAVRVLGGERRAQRDAHGALRCAYCHANVTGDEPDLVACDTCATAVHAACWEEHGGCPIWGCRGQRERARTSTS